MGLIREFREPIAYVITIIMVLAWGAAVIAAYGEPTRNFFLWVFVPPCIIVAYVCLLALYFGSCEDKSGEFPEETHSE